MQLLPHFLWVVVMMSVQFSKPVFPQICFSHVQLGSKCETCIDSYTELKDLFLQPSFWNFSHILQSLIPSPLAIKPGFFLEFQLPLLCQRGAVSDKSESNNRHSYHTLLTTGVPIPASSGQEGRMSQGLRCLQCHHCHCCPAAPVQLHDCTWSWGILGRGKKEGKRAFSLHSSSQGTLYLLLWLERGDFS